ncbi:MAG: hypothetical protein A3J83_00610 [Elusimicrobia bacterium RIFOXYA2_FULL_40_6]|nr:MAG: hypothetical protein A3J83_00610 [Elusimicrobia bacterium RIFOXYA2_FULL_40_6]
MTRKIKVTFLPDRVSVSIAQNKLTIKDAAKLAGVIIELQCGGKGKCGKCRVTITEGKSAPKSCLACQYIINKNSVVQIPKSAHVDRKKLLISATTGPKITNISKNIGVAIDIGTTTVVGVLADIESKQTLDVWALTNPQYVHGADVISRINYVINQENGLKIIQNEIVNAINQIIDKLCLDTRVNKINIREMSVVGNTTMQHFLLGIDPRSLSVAPYQPPVKGSYQIKKAIQLGIMINPEARVYVVPNIAGWVGGDTIGVILATKQHKSNKIKLSVDIGTNGEMVLGSKKKLLAASTAAGPCFEGARISCGMRATTGAIESVYMSEEGIFWRVIDRLQAQGICGSALIDTVAELLKFGIIDETGRIVNKAELEGKIPEVLLKSIIENESGNSFELTDKVILTQRDIRELQLAKAAIYAGIHILLKELKIAINEVDEILLAGTFGNYIDKSNAQKIGLIPNISLEKVRYVGNAACEGSRLTLVSNEERKEAEAISKSVNYIELSGHPDFQEAFVDAMMFNSK